MVGAAVIWNCVLAVPKEGSCSALTVGRTGPPLPFTAPTFWPAWEVAAHSCWAVDLEGGRGFEQELQVLGLLCRGNFWS